MKLGSWIGLAKLETKQGEALWFGGIIPTWCWNHIQIKMFSIFCFDHSRIYYWADSFVGIHWCVPPALPFAPVCLPVNDSGEITSWRKGFNPGVSRSSPEVIQLEKLRGSKEQNPFGFICAVTPHRESVPLHQCQGMCHILKHLE